jgi:Uncharacterized conserved small protein
MTSPTRSHAAPVTALQRPVFGRMLKALVAMRALHRQRRQLSAMEAHRLDDIGLSLDQARREAARPFWDAPSYWR